MKILIKSRKAVEKMSVAQFEPKTALISITDYDYDFAELNNEPEYLLQLDFDDVDNDVFEDELGTIPTEAQRISIEKKYHMLSDEQAESIADFYMSIRNHADTVICQCEHGQSRSAAVAAAIAEYEYKNGIDIFADDKYYPNKAVFRKVFNALNAAKKQ